jgi:hypothetical protein
LGKLVWPSAVLKPELTPTMLHRYCVPPFLLQKKFSMPQPWQPVGTAVAVANIF